MHKLGVCQSTSLLKMVVGNIYRAFINYLQLNLFKCSTVMHVKHDSIDKSINTEGNLSVI